MSELCAWCGAPKTSDPACFRCGANYAKAEAIKQRGSARDVVAAAPAPSATASPADDPDDTLPVRDPQAEWYNCLLALPLMLLGAWACQAFNVFDSLQRIMFGMPVHEAGHALTAWFTGHNAIPTLWFTRISPERGYSCGLLLLAAWAGLITYARRSRQPRWYWLVAVLFVLQVLGTFWLRPVTADELITFGGDGIGMVLATAMMATFYVGKDTQLYKGSVRWGLLFWGAAAFMDIFMAWWEGRKDSSRVGYGAVNGNHSDAYLLVNQYAWSWDQMFTRYLGLGFSCLAVLAVIYGLGLWQARNWLLADQRRQALERMRHKYGH